MINKATVSLIHFYQKYISPHKGYCCAYKVHHNDVSCSQFAKLTIDDVGFYKATSKIIERFRACKVSSDYIQNEYDTNFNQKDSKETHSEKCGHCTLNSCNVAACFS